MKKLAIFLKWFLYITTGIMIVCAINYTLAGEKSVTVNVFWKILFSSFMTTAVTLIFSPQREDKKNCVYGSWVIHYICLCVVMSFLGMWFGWIDFSFIGIGIMAADVGIVYFLTFVVYYIIDIKQADEINKVLQEKYGDDETL